MYTKRFGENKSVRFENIYVVCSISRAKSFSSGAAPREEPRGRGRLPYQYFSEQSYSVNSKIIMSNSQ